MSIETAEKIYKEIRNLRGETNALKELIFLVLKDAEGEYKNSFVNRVLKEARSKHRFIFTDKEDFLREISS